MVVFVNAIAEIRDEQREQRIRSASDKDETSERTGQRENMMVSKPAANATHIPFC